MEIVDVYYFDGELWDDVMYDLFPQAKKESDIEDELDDLWNDFDQEGRQNR